MRPLTRLAVLAWSLALVAWPGRGFAQEEPVLEQDELDLPTWGQVGFTFMATQSMGDLSESNAFGVGLEMVGRIFWGESGRLALRASVGVADYGWDGTPICARLRIVCPENHRSITNSISFLELGPELSWPKGRLRPFLNASIGIAAISTSERITEAFSDYVLETGLKPHDNTSWGIGGGMDLKIGNWQNPFVVSLGVQYHRFGWVRHLPEEAIVENPDGSFTISPIATRANFITYRIGAAVRVPG